MFSLCQFIVHGILLCGAVGFGVGVPTYQMLIDDRESSPQATLGLFGACADTSSDANCANLASDFYHCQKGDSGFSYSGLFLYTDPYVLDTNSDHLDHSSCARQMASEVFGILALVFAVFGFFGALYQERTYRHTGAGTAFLASMFGIVSMALFFSISPEALNNTATQPNVNNRDWANWVNEGTFKLGYSFGLQVAGIACTFFGSIFAAVVGKVPPTP